MPDRRAAGEDGVQIGCVAKLTACRAAEGCANGFVIAKKVGGPLRFFSALDVKKEAGNVPACSVVLLSSVPDSQRWLSTTCVAVMASTSLRHYYSVRHFLDRFF